jgi:hypothetical protein
LIGAGEVSATLAAGAGAEIAAGGGAAAVEFAIDGSSEGITSHATPNPAAAKASASDINCFILIPVASTIPIASARRGFSPEAPQF